jgi:hypothetical protein
VRNPVWPASLLAVSVASRLPAESTTPAMKAPLVHKFLRRSFMPFLFEHGLERPIAPTPGTACVNHAGFHIRLGYQLTGGFYDWTGNAIELAGTVSTKGVVRRSLQMNAVQPDDLLPAPLRTGLRAAGIEKLTNIVAEAKGRGAGPDLLKTHRYLVDPLRAAEADHLYVPEFRFRTEVDLGEWCRIVIPFVPACIAALKREAERLRDDA